MTTKGKKNGKAGSEFRFLNISLGIADKEWLQTHEIGAMFPLDMALSLVGEGYKLSFSYDERNSSYICSLTDRQPGSAFFNVCLSGRGATALDSWYALAYRHYILAEQKWDAIDNETPSIGTWG